MGATVTRPTRRNCRTTNYNTQNLLARSLHPQCYERNPGFQRFVAQSGLPFGPLTQFRREDLESRSRLYRQIAERIWDPDDLVQVGQP